MSLKPKSIDFQETWLSLKETVYGVVTLGKVGRSAWNSRFSDVYSLCVAHPEPMAERLYKVTKDFLEDHVANLLRRVASTPDQDLADEAVGEGLLQRYYDAWTQYSEGLQYLNNLYLYLNQQHIRKHKIAEAELIYGNTTTLNPEKLEVGELGLLSWELALDQQLRLRVIRALLAGVQAARENKPHRTQIIRTVIYSFVEIQAYRKKQPLALYTEMAESPLLEATSEHCRRLAAILLLRCNVSGYMREVITGMDQEMDRGKQFLHPSSLSKLKAVYEKHMVEEHLNFLHAEFDSMVIEERSEDLRNVYTLLRTLPGALRPLLDVTFNHIKDQGLKGMVDLKGESAHNQFVEQMLTIYDKYKDLFSQVFESDQLFMGALDKACSAVINSRQNEQTCRSPELLARYCDSLLRKSSRGVTESEAEEKLASSIIIFKYIDDKDIFQKFYAQLMAKRLIHQQSYSMDQEEAMINRLKLACGYEFTNKLLRMFTDINVSGDLNSKFQDYLKAENADAGVGFSIHVLQAGAWPLKVENCNMGPVPIQLEKPIQLFESFYRNFYSGRKLTWLHHLCMGELKLCYLRKPYYVTMQTAQMALVLEFEHTDTQSISELMRASDFSLEQLGRHIAPLIDIHLLTSEGNMNDIETIIRLNTGFVNKRTKVRVAIGASGGGGPRNQTEAERTAASVDEDRKMFLQAAIVRIMKARKVLKHNDLLQEVLGQARVAFAPNVAMIKKCIESLIDKQYIERTPGASDEYSYLA
ncbi:cullin 2 [Arctopsyche grandis]|uniref:cullin 2 n=1 Tax=Arctopsyche grandis TaxID=121162 RepID=UPI00406D9A3E